MPEWVGGEEAPGGDTAYASDSAFDFDAHIARLMAQADGTLVDSHDLDDEGEGCLPGPPHRGHLTRTISEDFGVGGGAHQSERGTPERCSKCRSSQ